MSIAHKYVVPRGDLTVRSAAEFKGDELVYMGIQRIEALTHTNQLRLPLAQLEAVLATFKDGCPEEVRGSISLMICAAEGWAGPGHHFHLAINGYRAPTKAEIAEMSAEAARAAGELNALGNDFERATYERLKAKFENVA